MVSDASIFARNAETGEYSRRYYINLFKTWAFLTFGIGFPMFCGIYLDKFYLVKSLNFPLGTFGGSVIVFVSFLMWILFRG